MAGITGSVTRIAAAGVTAMISRGKVGTAGITAVVRAAREMGAAG
jgi:hypothetical protein